MEIIIIIIMFVVSTLVISVVIRGAIDSSKLPKQLDMLTDEIRMLRKEIKENKHIVDKKV
ncbi:hypothetical protein [Paenibacillus prosopidis]|uniref:Uncharacterized protein n=1 Tax=Paenibacillus prosopidis TaxID=630520 RepID=A0A368W921_9BACL|nr:hypothetical protein [Paenibacillus prosopidis]RCW50026.1 hypothetical protein DFP97_10342 [Paenibacillus prosopidis]